jgi:hypothetical protein
MKFRVEVVCINDAGQEHRSDIREVERRQLATDAILSPGNVTAGSFGRLADPVRVDGQICAQPLYEPSVAITINGQSQGVHNVVYVATEANTVWAIDADTYKILWHTLPVGPPAVVADLGSHLNCGYWVMYPSMGITSTPVIDSSNNVMYVVAKLELGGSNGPTFEDRIYMIDIGSGTIIKQLQVSGEDVGSPPV